MKVFSRAMAVTLAAILLLVAPSCQQTPVEPSSSQQKSVTESVNQMQLAVTVNEGYEAGTKTSYTAADVTFGSGVWNLNEALVGTSASDPKVGTKSVRVRTSGKVTMKFNRTDGAGVVTVKHAKYGADANTTWQLWYSTNSGSTWTQTGATVTTSTTSLSTASFTVNIAGTIRFEIRKTDGSANRTNFDDFVINDYSAVPTNVHLTFGNPSNAVTNSTTHANNYLMEKTWYALSYSDAKKTPNWTAWHLDPSYMSTNTWGNSTFISDVTLPVAWTKAVTADYTNSNFSRGHMCPSADRDLTDPMNEATYIMTNVVPQNQENNDGPWGDLEDYCRTLVAAGNELYIYSGGYGQGGQALNGTFYNTLKNLGKITVPSHVWKVVVVLPQGTNDVSRVTTGTRVIAIWQQNILGYTAWGPTRVSVDYLESQLGYNFLANVPDAIENVIEASVDAGPTN